MWIVQFLLHFQLLIFNLGSLKDSVIHPFMCSSDINPVSDLKSDYYEKYGSFPSSSFDVRASKFSGCFPTILDLPVIHTSSKIQWMKNYEENLESLSSSKIQFLELEGKRDSGKVRQSNNKEQDRSPPNHYHSSSLDDKEKQDKNLPNFPLDLEPNNFPATSFDDNPNKSCGFLQLPEEHDKNLPKHSLPSSFDEKRSKLSEFSQFLEVQDTKCPSPSDTYPCKSSRFSQFIEEQDRKFPSPSDENPYTSSRFSQFLEEQDRKISSSFDQNPHKSTGFSQFLEEQAGKFPSSFDQNPYKSTGSSQFLEEQDRQFPSPLDDNPRFSDLLEEKYRNLPNFPFHVQPHQHSDLSSTFFFDDNHRKSRGFSNLLEEPDIKLPQSFGDDPNMSSRFSQHREEQDINFLSFSSQFQPDYYLSPFFDNNPRNSNDGFSQILEEHNRNLPIVPFHVQPTKHYPSSSYDHDPSKSNGFLKFLDSPTLNGFKQQPETTEEVQNGCCFSAENSVAIKNESTSGQNLIFPHEETPSKFPSANHRNYQTQTQQCDDGYKWRKYGQKQVKGNENPRSYYKCAYPNCQSKKKVESSLVNGEITRILYRGTHNHVKPLSNRRSNATSSSYSAIPALNPVKVEISDHHQSVSNNVTEHETWKMGVNKEKPRIAIQTTSEIDLVNDGYRWRKYGQKLVKGNPNPRSYYKCTHPGCPVRKHIERALDNVGEVITTYEGRHTHKVPSPAYRNDLSHKSLNNNMSLSNPTYNTATLNHQINGNNNNPTIANHPLSNSSYALPVMFMSGPTSFTSSRFENSIRSHSKQ